MIETISNNQTNNSVQISGGVDSKTIAALTQRIDDIQGDVTELQNCCIGVRETIDGLDNDIEDLDGRVTQNTGDITTAQDSITSMRDDIDEISDEIVPRGVTPSVDTATFYNSHLDQLFDLPGATSTTAGLLTSSDKSKLDEFASLYNNVTIRYGEHSGSRVFWKDDLEVYAFEDGSISFRVMISKFSSSTIQQIALMQRTDSDEVIMLDDTIVPVRVDDNKSYGTGNVTITENSSFWMVVTIDGKQYKTEEIDVYIVPRVYYGFAESYPDISELTGYTKPIKKFEGEIFRSTNMLGASANFFIAVPSFVTPFTYISSNGFPVYSELIDYSTEDGIQYAIYKVGSTYSNGTRITITVD